MLHSTVNPSLKTKIPILGLFVPDLGMKAKRV